VFQQLHTTCPDCPVAPAVTDICHCRWQCFTAISNVYIVQTKA